MTVDDYIELGRRMLSQYYERFQPFNDGVLLGAELNLTFTLPNTGFGFRSIVDRLWRRPDGGIEIWDYKTGNRLAQGARDPQYRRQMALYQLAVQSRYADYRDITLVQYFLKHGEAIRCVLSEEELDELDEQFRQDVLAIRDAVRLDAFPTHEGPICHFCDYVELCPAKRHRLLLDKEAGTDGHERTTIQTAAELAEEYVRLDRQIKELQAKQRAVRDDVVRSAKELELDKLVTPDGDLRVRIVTEEKFPTRSRDNAAFMELSMLARQWGLDECFRLDERALMKDVYKKGRLDDDQRRHLESFVITEENQRLTVPRRRDEDDDPSGPGDN